MSALQVIADDVTGACDVGAELAAVGFRVRVAVTGAARDDDDGGVRVVNTQSRTVRAGEAYTRVLRAARRGSIDILLKKIDTALRGHLGAELDAAIDGLGATAAFVAPAIPSVGRVTRDGQQWFDGRRLAETEFASDPEGGGGESSVAAVVARESRRRTEVIGLDTLRAGRLAERARTLIHAGAELFVVDAESDDDLTSMVRAILQLPRPLCVVGSIGVAAPLAAALRPDRAPPVHPFESVPRPVLVVCGSLHSMAAAQVEAVCGPRAAHRLTLPSRPGEMLTAAPRAQLVAAAGAALGDGRNVAVVVPRPATAPDIRDRHLAGQALAETVRDVLRLGKAAGLVLIGGETTFAVLAAIGASELTVLGRIAPLVTAGTIDTGEAAGLPFVVKGGSGGEAGSLRALLDAGLASRRVAS